MTRFLLRRAGWFVITVWVVMTLSFMMMRATPGGPFSSERALNGVVEQNIRARYHLDWPVWRQYLHYVGPFNLDEHGVTGDRTRTFGGVLAGDLGPSFAYRDHTVSEILAQSLPVSIVLGAAGMAVALLLEIPWATFFLLQDLMSKRSIISMIMEIKLRILLNLFFLE